MIKNIPSEESYRSALSENEECTKKIQFYDEVIDVADEWLEVGKGFAKLKTFAKRYLDWKEIRKSQESFLQKAQASYIEKEQKRTHSKTTKSHFSHT